MIRSGRDDRTDSSWKVVRTGKLRAEIGSKALADGANSAKQDD